MGAEVPNHIVDLSFPPLVLLVGASCILRLCFMCVRVLTSRIMMSSWVG